VPAQGPALVYACGQCEIDLGRRELRSEAAAVPLGGRAFDILEVLIRSDGKLVTKDDLMHRVWAGAIVEENTLQVYISAIRKALGPDRALLKTVSGRGYQMLGAWALRPAGDPPAPALASTPAPLPLRRAQTVPTNLPLVSPDLLGRVASVQHLRDLIAAHRVVTLTGPGGIGKTRLALQVARDILPRFDGDGWLVDLAAISDPALVPSAAGAVLGLMFGDEPVSPDTVARAIGPKRVLLVLDNCEHVIESAALLAEAIVRACPGAAILATSRELLRIDGEHAFRVPPLDLPDADATTPEDLLRHSAVQLFIARMTASRTTATLDAHELALAAAICRRLDGIPLAIEFAAARATTLGLEAVLSRLDERFKLLTIGRRTALPRHQTLRATLDWSYELLPEPEQTLLRFLGIFMAGFSLAAASAVIGRTDQILDNLGALVVKSLVVVDGRAPGGRWRLLETTRAYALEKLKERGELPIAAERHATFVLDRITQLGAAAALQPVSERMEPHVRGLDDVRAALDWAFSPGGDAAVGIALTAAFTPAWLHLSLMVECRERITQALAHRQTQISPALDMRLHIALGLSLVFTTGLVAQTEAALAKGLERAEALDDLDNQLAALWTLWFYHMTSGELRAAEPFATRVKATASSSGVASDLLLAGQIVAATLHYQGSQQEARRYLDRVEASSPPPNDGRYATWILSDVQLPARTMLARVRLLQGFPDQAAQDAQASFGQELARRRPVAICTVLRYGVCAIALTTGDIATAAWSVAMLRDLAARHGSAFWARIARCLEGALLIKRGEFAAGTELLNAALAKVRNQPPDMLAILAEGAAGIGRHADALATVEQRIARSGSTGEQWYDPELHRIKGELLWQPATDAFDAPAEACFQTAIALARAQGALLWELKAVLALVRLRIRQNRAPEAYETLAPVYDRFTEGFGITELRFARTLLDALRAGDASTLPEVFARRL